MEIRNPKYKELTSFLKDKPAEFTFSQLADKFNLTYNQTKGFIRGFNTDPERTFDLVVVPQRETKLEVRPSQKTKERFRMNLKPRNTERVLVVGDPHEPFCLPGYLEFCKEVYVKYDCTHVIFAGDLIDNHFVSYHETDPDGLSAIDELQLAVSKLSKWVEAFPQADVCIGNHDRLVARKAFSSGISALWLRDYNEVLQAPGWDFQEEFIYDGVRYIHGEQGSARLRAKKDLISTVQGHRHTEAYTEHLVGMNYRIFGTQVGCGVDHKAYAMAYAKAGSKPVIGCAVILDHGKLPINILAEL